MGCVGVLYNTKWWIMVNWIPYNKMSITLTDVSDVSLVYSEKELTSETTVK
jgi:hypothetical protein